MHIRRSTLVALSALVLWGCSDDAGQDSPPASGTCVLTLPASYDGSKYESNAASELGLRTSFSAFTQKMKDAEADLTLQPTAAELAALFEAGAPGLKATTSSAFQPRVAGLLAEFEASAGKSYVPQDPPEAGGKFGNYIFSAHGTDLRQAIEKGLFGAAFYHQALALMAGAVDETTPDRLIALFGAHPTFPADDKAASNPDVLAAAYAERRDKKDSAQPGPYLKMKAAFIQAQAAIRAGQGCNADRDEALATLRTEWERAIFATVVFYLNDAATKLAIEPPTESTQSAGLHSYGEVIGFVSGFRGLPTSGRTITDAQLEDLLATLGAPVDAEVTSYKLVTDTASQLSALQQAAGKIASIYQFSAADLEAYKVNN